MRRCFILFLISNFFFLQTFVSLLAKDSKGVEPIGVHDKNGDRIILYEKSFALLIGVSKYQYSGWNALPSIPGEIKLLEESLKKHEFIIEKSLNPTSAILKKKIEEFISNNGLKPNNRLLIFFSGHGCTRKVGENRVKGYIVPADAPRPEDNKSEFVNKAIEMGQIHTWAKKIESKHALFVFDSCFCGTIFLAKGDSIPNDISYLIAEPVRQFITAGDENDMLPPKSCMVPYFIKGIGGGADYTNDGYITCTELGIYLRQSIISYKNCGTPRYGKIRDHDLDKGEFVFICRDCPKPPPPPPPPPPFIKMVHVPSGTFLRGTNKDQIDELIRICSRWQPEFFKNETPQKEIEVDSFYISKYEITNEQYGKFLNDNPSHEQPAFWYNENFNKPDQPVVGVSWHDAVAYCNWLTEKTNETFRLPTEAEWEKAAQGTDGRFFPWGNEWPTIDRANYIDQHDQPVPVKEKPGGASPFKLMHMAGNVSEWCSDWYDENYYESLMNLKNPKGPQEGEKRVVRGGDWSDNAFYLRCKARVSYPPDTRNQFVGFRIVREAGNE